MFAREVTREWSSNEAGRHVQDVRERNRGREKMSLQRDLWQLDVAYVGPMPLVSVITPTHQVVAPFLREAYESLLIQDADWEWVLQFDGRAWALPRWCAEDPRVRLELNGRNFGLAMTRNRGLMRARGEYIQTLDPDDYLLPGALSVVSGVLNVSPHLAYAYGRLVVKEVDGYVRPGGLNLPFGEVAPGVVGEYWREHELAMPFRAASAMLTREAAFAYGGWPALEVGEDCGLLLAIAADYPGCFVDYETFCYRIQAESMMNDSEYWSVQRPRDNAFNRSRLDAIARLRASALGGQSGESLD